MTAVGIAAVALNQTPLDWKGNQERILLAAEYLSQLGCQIMCFPELSISGYGCEDYYLSSKTAAEALASLQVIESQIPAKTMALIGLPIQYDSAVFNVAALIVDREVKGFVAKRFLCRDGVHFEPRWFSAWPIANKSEIEFNGRKLPIGDIHFKVGDLKIGVEICEDAWVKARPMHELVKQSVNLILNPSASHFGFKKFAQRKALVLAAGEEGCQCYVYANLLGCESGRTIYDGDAIISHKDQIVSQSERFSFKEFNYSLASIDFGVNQNTSTSSSELLVDIGAFDFVTSNLERKKPLLWESEQDIKDFEYNEFVRAVSLGLFDYLRKTRSQGFVISLSGGADSASVALLVHTMLSYLIFELGFEEAKKRLHFLTKISTADTQRQIAGLLLSLAYQKTSNSSETTLNAARTVAENVGGRFLVFDIDPLVTSYTKLLEKGLGLNFEWGKDDIVLQNIQARTRAPGIWMLANKENKLLLTTSNRSEASVGYATMDGDTAGGFNPIGGVSKEFILRWLKWLEKGNCEVVNNASWLKVITSQAPTAELRPQADSQTDESDLMPYVVLDFIERQILFSRLSLKETLENLCVTFTEFDRKTLFGWLEKFCKLWNTNQWKRERYAPCFHIDEYSVDPKTWCRMPIISSAFYEEIDQLRKEL